MMEMFSSYTPSFTHAVYSIFLCMLFVVLSGFAPAGRILTACYIGAIFFFIITGIILYMLITNHNIDAHIRQVEAQTAWMKEWNKLDGNGQQAVQHRFFQHKILRLKEGIVVSEFESSKVEVSYWQTFLLTSDRKYVSPKRDWVTNTKPAAAWDAIYNWLVDHDYVYQDSSAGNHSYEWVGESYDYLSANWQMAGRTLVNLNKVDEIAKRYDAGRGNTDTERAA